MKEPVFDKNLNFIDRRFLNSSFYHTTGNIIGKLCKDGHWIDSSLHISDCSRSISLDMETETEEDIDNSVFKLTQIIEVCEKYKTALENLRPYIIDKKKYEGWREEEDKKKKDE